MQKTDLYQVMFKYATLGILIAKSDGTIVKTNPFAEKLFGYEEHELEGQLVDVLIPDALRGGHAKHRDSYHRNPKERVMGANLDLFAKRKDGATFPVEISLGHTEFDGEKMAIAYINDITEQKKAKVAIQQEKEMAQMYLDIAGSMTVVIDKEERITLLNQRGEEILGVSEEKVIHKNWFDLFIPESEREDVRAVFGKLMKNKVKNVEYYENSIINKNGEKRLIWWHNRVLFDEGGEVQGTISSGVDITEQRQAEKSLKESQLILQNYTHELEKEVSARTADLAESEQKLNQAQAIAKIGHWDIMVESDKLEISKGMYQIFGIKPDAVVSSKLIDTLNHPEDRKMVRDNFKKVIASKKGISMNHRIITSNGDLKYILSSIQAPIFDDDGKLIRLFGVVKDITSLKVAELQLHESLSKEKELSLLKSRFVSMASHEFRTPLSSILSSAELIGMYIEAGKSEKTKKNINRIKNSVRNLTGILNDFLSLEKLEAGKVEVQKETIDLVEYFDELVEEIKPILRPEQHLLFETNDLKTFQTDPYLLKNILINLISNAIKYSPKGEDVTLALEKEKNQLIFKVIDRGIGIPDADKQHMFTRFFRASNVENIKGTGLGLTIVKRYLDLLGGDIGFESEYGKGSTFHFHIPNITINKEL